MNHGTDNQKILGNCPSCQKLMQIPVVTDVSSVAKCPHCRNEIRVRDLLASVVPEAEIIGDEKLNGQNNEPDYVADRQRVYDDSKPKTREKFEVPNQLYNGASRRNRKRRGGSSSSRGGSSSSRGGSSSSRGGSQGSGGVRNGKVNNSPNLSSSGSIPVSKTARVDQGSDVEAGSKPRRVAATGGATPQSRSAATGKTVRPRPTPTPMPRPNRSSRSRRSSSDFEDEVEFGLADIFKFLGGGIIAAPLAYLALIWVLGVDPFGLASTFEGISPSIVPSAMRSESLGDESRSGFAPPAGESSSLLFAPGAQEDNFDDNFEEEGLPLPSLDPDLVR